jgi:hypothetical protein
VLKLARFRSGWAGTIFDTGVVKNPSRLEAAPRDFDRSWIVDAVLPFHAFAVGSLVPIVFEAYGRIFHPASGPHGVPVRWDTVAAWSGRTVHSLAEFERLAIPRPGVGSPSPFVQRPTDGSLRIDALDVLREHLAAQTSTPDQCYFGIWEGFSWLEPGRSRTPTLTLPERVYAVFRGPIEAASEVGWTRSNQRFMHESPSLLWPADRAWFVSTDVDQDSTFLGGSRSLLDALEADPQLEVWPVKATDPITAGSDLINV